MEKSLCLAPGMGVVECAPLHARFVRRSAATVQNCCAPSELRSAKTQARGTADILDLAHAHATSEARVVPILPSPKAPVRTSKMCFLFNGGHRLNGWICRL